MASRTGTPKAFLPGDPRVEEPYRLTPQLAFRVAVMGFLALAVFAVLFLRLWALQVLAGDKYLARAQDNRVRSVRLDAPRGAIVDRNGRVLVTNVAGVRLELWPADMPKRWPAERKELRALTQITGVPVSQMLKKLREHGDDPLTPVVVQTGLHNDQVDYLEEHQVQFPGIQLAKSWLRRYPYQSLAAQVLGYVGQISPEEYKQLKSKGYFADDSIGQAGIERTYDTYLRGQDGEEQLTVDSRGRPKGELKPQVNPTPGDVLKLTIDINLQRAAEKALRLGIQTARTTPEGAHADGAALVAMDPSDGSILAMASYPTYKPSIYVGRPDPAKLAPLLNTTVAEKDNFPGLNRALQVGYPPGSAFKPVTALAAMQQHLVTPYDLIPCTPSYIAYKEKFNNWTDLIDQAMDMKTALAESCDTYFYELGRRFFVLPGKYGHPLQGWANRFGLGELTGIDLSPETSGLIPTPEWRKTHFPASEGYGAIDRIWKPGYSIQMAIGQGDMLVTPLQMTRLYAMIANGGLLVTPHIGEDVEQSGQTGQARVLRRFGAQQPQPTGVDPAALQVVRDGLLEAAQSAIGTSSGVFGQFPVSIAGKTGTAEKLVTLPGYPHAVKLNQSWWCGYGPTDAAQIVVCAVIENGGHGGTAAAPAALKVFEQFFGKNATTTSHISD